MGRNKLLWGNYKKKLINLYLNLKKIKRKLKGEEEKMLKEISQRKIVLIILSKCKSIIRKKERLFRLNLTYDLQK